MNISDLDRLHAKEIIKRFTPVKEDRYIFYDLVFCICAPQTTFINNRKVVDFLISKDLFEKEISKSVLQEILKPVRFYKRKAEFVLEAKKNFYHILNFVKDPAVDSKKKRDWLVKNVKGLGMKAASHFLRNLGVLDLAIIDTHILKFLNITGKWDYTIVEKQFQEKSRELNLNPAELDAIVWKLYSKTDWKDFLF